MQTLNLSDTTSVEHLTPAAVGALGALLESMPGCTHLVIDDLIPHPSALLLPALASTSISKVSLEHDRMTEVQLMLWCAGGQVGHPITVGVASGCQIVGNVSHVLSVVPVPGSGVNLVLHPDTDDDDYGDWEDDGM